MELLLIRHGLPRKVVNVDTPADPPLDHRGWEQAHRLADYLLPEGIHAVWASPMVRAQETAQPLAKVLGVDVSTDNDLAEWDRESSAYIPIEELKATNHPDWQAMLRGEWTGSLDPIEFQQTVVRAVERIVDAHRGQRVAVVCHGGVISTYLAHILEIPKPGGFFHPEYTSIHRVMAASSGERSIRTLNETAHLRGTGLL